MKAPSDQIHPIVARAAGAADGKLPVAARSHRARWQTFKCCGCVAAILLIAATIFLTLIFTLFKLKGPTIQVHQLSIGKLDFANGTNMTLNADVWVSNPNFAHFTYGNLTTELFYRSEVVGAANGPPGKARARRTTRVNVTVDIMMDRIVSAPGFDSDMASGLVNMSSYTRVGGRMRAFVVIEKKFTVRMNCSMTFNITGRAILQHECKRKVKVKI